MSVCNLFLITFMLEKVCSQMYAEPNLHTSLTTRSWSPGNRSKGTYFQNWVELGSVDDPQCSLNWTQSPEWFWISIISVWKNGEYLWISESEIQNGFKNESMLLFSDLKEENRLFICRYLNCYNKKFKKGWLRMNEWIIWAGIKVSEFT